MKGGYLIVDFKKKNLFKKVKDVVDNGKSKPILCENVDGVNDAFYVGKKIDSTTYELTNAKDTIIIQNNDTYYKSSFSIVKSKDFYFDDVIVYTIIEDEDGNTLNINLISLSGEDANFIDGIKERIINLEDEDSNVYKINYISDDSTELVIYSSNKSLASESNYTIYYI